MKKLPAFILFLQIICNGGLAQISEQEFDASLQHEDLLIMSDSMVVTLYGEKAFYINVSVERAIRFKILKETGIGKLKTFTLPMPFDAMYKPHNSAILNFQRLFDQVTVKGFSALRMNSPTPDTIKTYRRLEDVRMVSLEDRFVHSTRYVYYLAELVAGDEIMIRYSYFFPYANNFLQLTSCRFHFHDSDPKQKMYMSLSYPRNLETDTLFVNGAKANITADEKEITCIWELDRLPGCLDEPGSRPHADLPWFSFTPKPYELLYQEFNTFREYYIPMWFFLGLPREDKLRKGIVDNDQGVKTKDHFKFENLAARYKSALATDSSGLTGIRYFQRYVVDSTRYQDDFDLFNQDLNYEKDHPGTELSSGIVREHNKESIYAHMIPRLANTFLSAYVSDVRQGYMSQEFFAPMLDNEILLYAVLHNNTGAFLLPKSDLRNCYAEELPFYYENAPVILMYTYDYAGYKRNFNEEMRIINTPSSTMKDNSRIINSMVTADLNNAELQFSTKITLTGQYSTVTRCIYTGQPFDSTIHPTYAMKPWEISAGSELKSLKPNGTQYYFPFKFTAEAKYSDKTLLSVEDDKFTIDLSGWFRHVIYRDLQSETRFLDFYPDFSGTDSWAYMITFNEPVEIVTKPDAINIDTEFGKFVFEIKQLNETQLLVNSYFAVKTLMVKKENISAVEDIYQAILKSENSRFIVSRKE